MRILLLSLKPWRKDNSLGNSYSSVFGEMENVEIAHIFSFNEKPDYEKNVKRYYQIKEDDVIKSVLSLKRGKGVGKEVSLDSFLEPKQKEHPQKKSFYSKVLSFGKKHHWMSLYWARELAWKFGNIDYKGLIDFVRDFNPDIFFLSFGNVFISNRLALYIKRQTGVPMIVHMQMDHYSLKRVSFNPLFWIDRFLKRRMIRKLAKETEVIYCISKRLKNELEDSLKVPCKVLYKIPDNKRSCEPYHEIHEPIKFLYAGNIYANRWKVLSLLAECLKKEQLGHLDIYTANPITKEIGAKLNIEGVSTIHGPISQDEVIRLQNEADVLVHVESFDLKNKLLVRCAISTKIMDYLSVGRSILAIGPTNIDSIDFLRDSNAAMIANSEKELIKILNDIKSDKNLLFDYSKRGVNYVREHLDANTMRTNLYNEMAQVVSIRKTIVS